MEQTNNEKHILLVYRLKDFAVQLDVNTILIT